MMPILEIESRLLIYKTRVITTILYRQYVFTHIFKFALAQGDRNVINLLDLEEYFCKL